MAPPRTKKGSTRRTQAERSEATRTALVSAARPLFAERGYAEVGTEAIVRAAGVTRGALYHQFPGGKRELFEAVYEAVESDLTEQILATAGASPDPLAELRAGVERFLDASLDPEVQRIVLLDGPAVLGWERWREIAARHGLGLVEGVVQAAIDAGQFPEQPVKPLAHVLMGAVDEAAMYVARAERQPEARAEMGASLGRILDGLAAG
jgi:AcrR family transcriptional regulator